MARHVPVIGLRWCKGELCREPQPVEAFALNRNGYPSRWCRRCLRHHKAALKREAYRRPARRALLRARAQTYRDRGAPAFQCRGRIAGVGYRCLRYTRNGDRRCWLHGGARGRHQQPRPARLHRAA